MLTDDSLRDLLREGHRTSDAELVANTVKHMSRTVYLMTQFLAEHQDGYCSSIDLQRHIDEHLAKVGVQPTQRLNPVDWFSAEWTKSLEGKATPHFKDAYRELFNRDPDSKDPWRYRIEPTLHESVVRILSELGTSPHSARPTAE